MQDVAHACVGRPAGLAAGVEGGLDGEVGLEIVGEVVRGEAGQGLEPVAQALAQAHLDGAAEDGPCSLACERLGLALEHLRHLEVQELGALGAAAPLVVTVTVPIPMPVMVVVVMALIVVAVVPVVVGAVHGLLPAASIQRPSCGGGATSLPMTLQLYGMRFSPYSEKARWALDHHRVPFQWHEHVPLAGELALRMRAGSLGKKVSVPLAIDGDVVLRDSVEIARHTEKIGKGSPLAPDDAASQDWDARSAAALGAGRVLVIRRSLEDHAALRDSLPRWMPHVLRGVSTPIAANANRFLLRKYDAEGIGSDAARETMRQQLLALRAALGDRATLASDFSYADLTMSVVLQMVVPVDERFIRLGDARRRAWTDETLAAEFPDLVAWRDRLYAEHRAAHSV